MYCKSKVQQTNIFSHRKAKNHKKMIKKEQIFAYCIIQTDRVTITIIHQPNCTACLSGILIPLLLKARLFYTLRGSLRSYFSPLSVSNSSFCLLRHVRIVYFKHVDFYIHILLEIIVSMISMVKNFLKVELKCNNQSISILK